MTRVDDPREDGMRMDEDVSFGDAELEAELLPRLKNHAVNLAAKVKSLSQQLQSSKERCVSWQVVTVVT